MKVGIDGGQKSLKITLTVAHPSVLTDPSGVSLNSVAKIHLIGVAMDVPECDVVLREMWSRLDVENSLPAHNLIVADYKVFPYPM